MPTTAGGPNMDDGVLTVLFCDLVGSTSLAVELDPEDFREVIQRYHHQAEQVVEAHEGRVAQYMGDGVVGYFTFAAGSDAAACRAIRAGRGLVEGVATVAADLFGNRDHLTVRIGVHTGPAVVESWGARDADRTAFGVAPQMAARIQELAAPGSVAVSARTRELAEQRFEFTERESLRLGADQEPLRVFGVVRELTQ